jgi:hypothetical protein
MRLTLLVLLAFAGCASPPPQGDSAALAGIDTLKAAPADSTLAADSGVATAEPTPRPPTSSTKSSTKTVGATTATDTAHLGRDRAIKINTRDPRRRLPTVDTTKRPP